MRRVIENGEVSYCLHSGCRGAVKPDVVFFGESLPAAFDVEVERMQKADLVARHGDQLEGSFGCWAAWKGGRGGSASVDQ